MGSKKTTAVCKICRREGKKLFRKGDRCFGAKCAVIKRNYPPGVHGPKGKVRLTSFGVQLREKQKAKRFYGLMEKQFRNYFQDAISQKGDTGEIFLSLLERRLDSVVFRLGFAASRKHARQLVSHGHFLVNGKMVNIPSYQVRLGDEIAVCTKARSLSFFQEILTYDARESAPAWMNVDRKALVGKIVSLPKTDDLTMSEFDIKRIVEYYSK